MAKNHCIACNSAATGQPYTPYFIFSGKVFYLIVIVNIYSPICHFFVEQITGNFIQLPVHELGYTLNDGYISGKLPKRSRQF
jgi:hypothetical protein